MVRRLVISVAESKAAGALLLLFAATPAFLICPRAVAQEARGTIVGQILDGAGAVVPGAAVTATNVATNARMETLTNGAGQYIFPFLIPGVYNLSAAAKGFKTSLRDS